MACRSPSRTNDQSVTEAVSASRSVGVGAVELRAEERPVAEGVEPADDVEVVGRVRVGRADHVQVVGHRRAGTRVRGAQRLHGEAVAEVEVVHRGQGVGLVLPAGGVDAGAVAEVGGAPRLVQGGPGVHPVAEDLRGLAGVRRERLRRRPGGPAAGVLQLLRQVPVVQRRDRGDPGGEEPVDQPGVEVQAPLVERAGAAGLDPRPRQREAVRLQTQLPHQADVLGRPGGSGRPPRHRCRRAAPGPGCARRCPRSTGYARPPPPPPRSGSWP